MSNPTPGQRPDWVDDDLYPFESRFLEHDGHVVHYVDEGAGPTLLMLHGNPSWSFLYRDLIAELRDQFRCVAIDYPGFGLSSAAPDYDYTAAAHARVLATVIDALELDAYTPIVQDWAGPIGLWAAAQHPERVRALIVGNTWAWPNDTLPAKAFSTALGGAVGRELIERTNLFAARIVPLGHRRRRLTDAELTHYTAPFPTPEARVPTHVFPREIQAARPFLVEVESLLPRLKDRPALITWGTADAVFPAAVRRRWERLLPNHTTHLLFGAGHYIQDDAGYEMSRAILDWWGDDGPRTGP